MKRLRLRRISPKFLLKPPLVGLLNIQGHDQADEREAAAFVSWCESNFRKLNARKTRVDH